MLSPGGELNIIFDLVLIFHLAVGLHPIVRHYAEPTTVKVCDEFALYCEINSLNAKVWWTQNGTEIDDSFNVTFLGVDDETLVSTWRLDVSCAQPTHSGNYTCHVKTVDSSVHYSKSVIFNITGSRPFAESLSIRSSPWVLGHLGQKTVLNCTVNGTPLPSSIDWSKNGTRVESSELINVSQRVINSSEMTSSLEILNLTKSHLGSYLCLAATNATSVSFNTTIVNKRLSLPANFSVHLIDHSSVEIKWASLPTEVPIDRYKINVTKENGNPFATIDIIVPSHMKYGAQTHVHRIVTLQPDKTYNFKIIACNDYLGCGDELISDKVSLPGYSSPPTNLTLTCHYDNISMESVIHAMWARPLEPKSDISEYKVTVRGIIRSHDLRGAIYPPINMVLKTNATYIRTHVDPNTNYTLQICAITSVGCGALSDDVTCSTPPTVPYSLPFFELKRVDATEDCRQLKLSMKRISQRNGPIKCYRVVLYKMKHAKQPLPLSDNIDLLSYDEVHKEGSHGAYVAEAFNGETFHKEIILGDEAQSYCKDPLNVRSSRSIVDEADEVVYDGELAAETYYSGFVEVKVIGKDEILTKRSSLFMPIKTGAVKYSLHATALGVICGLLIVILILAVALCALSKRNNLQDYDGGFRLCNIVCGPFGPSHRHGLAGTPVLPPPDVKPLKPENLPLAFQERHKDSDLLFQREFESLPEMFQDRTTRASDKLENFFKNRYPDIKAYDQTRVKLSTVDGIAGSDYINANFVMGYKDRKKFICAQGPLDKTVNDFWRMIWEQKVTIVVMVTGLEENGKMKCTKYWPDEEDKKFGNIAVIFKKCQVFSDYTLRKFTVCHKQDESISETRELLQFHYQTWKDFLAPEHPGGILKFIKRVNEAFSPDKGPILVHCSAGVGRTGTLVVVDSLLQQMRDEGQIEIFNFVAKLRRQRNFLVQSLKQYIFVYRALMEFAQFGDTEIEVKKLGTSPSSVEMKAEFEKLIHVIEDSKTCDVATTEVNASKNRVASIVPYDRNRVILTPVPSREHSSYINASYIQGYDRATSFIITQDPMESSLSEFWRMVHEQNSSMVVMLSENSNPQCWPDSEAEYDHIALKCTSSESFPHYTKRNITVTNTKSSKFHSVSHYHFHNWTDNVPSDTVGVISLIGAMNLTSQCSDASDETVVVHCSEAGHRSAIVVTCYILAHQCEHEKRIDVFQIVRNMRSQRQGLFQNFESYKFCYQFALDYVKSVVRDE